MGGDAGKSSVSWFWALSQRFWAGILDFPVWPVGRAGRGGVQGFVLLVAFQQSFEHQSIRVGGYWGPLGTPRPDSTASGPTAQPCGGFRKGPGMLSMLDVERS